jgi:glutathione peroxidase
MHRDNLQAGRSSLISPSYRGCTKNVVMDRTPLVVRMQKSLLSSTIGMILAAQLLSAASVYDYELNTINYQRVRLRDFKGKVLMIVNVASYCGYTPQYAGLQKLYLTHVDQGFVIVGIPSNDFGEGEPGSDPEIKQFCRRKYDVTFPMMSKVFIKANPRLPLYDYLTDEHLNPKTGGEIRWNFTKFLIGRDGTILARFEPDVTPEDPSLVKAVENALR